MDIRPDLLDGERALYVGTADGLYVLRGNTARDEWLPAGRSLAGYDISALAWDSAGAILVGTADGKLFRSGNGGVSWQPAGAGLPGPKIWSLVVDPHAADVFYAGLGGGHLFRSDDGGASWHELEGLRALPTAAHWWGPFGEAIFHSLLPVAGRRGALYAGLSVVGALASDDGGASWRDVTGEIPRMPHMHTEDRLPELADLHKLALHPRDPARLYATTHYGTFRSDDGAESWQSIGEGLPFPMTRPLVLHPREPDTVWVICRKRPHA